jgi:hypothetical protein
VTAGSSTPATVLDHCPRCGAPTGSRCYDLRSSDRRTAIRYHPERTALRPTHPEEKR